MTTRVLPAITTAQQAVTVNGRKYNAQPGTAIDAPDGDADVLGANGWIRVCPSGTSAQRPTGSGVIGGTGVVTAGSLFFDSTLGFVIVFDGKSWRNPATGVAI
ncbi:MAG: hypothetical protein ACRESA_08910 [Gammaproteobacteria bacterium]